MRDWFAHYWAFGAVRRACRAAIVMPSLFAFGSQVVGNPTVALFAGFGSFAMLLLVDFGGPLRARAQALAGLAVTAAFFLVIGTLVSTNVWLAALTMLVLAFVVLFAGVVSSVLAGAGTSLVLAAILAISVPGPPSSIPARLLGWGIASVVALLAVTFLWPLRTDDTLRAPAVRACRAVADRLRAELCSAPGQDTASAEGSGSADAVTAKATAEVEALHRTFLATPYRPTGLSTAARALVRLVDEINLLGAILAAAPLPTLDDGAGPAIDAVRRAAAEVLDRSADLLENPALDDAAQRTALAGLRAALAELEHRAALSLPVAVTGGGLPSERIEEFVTSLEPGFRSEEISFVVTLIADNIATEAAAERRGWWSRVLGGEPGSVTGQWASAWARASAHLERHSVWLHNSLRGAVGLALAVAIADQSGLAHSFWVVFGTLSVLRSNALNTGQTVARGVFGTTVGFLVGAGLLQFVGTDRAVLWALLPFAILLAGAAPVFNSFAAGQAAFTLTLLILFNIVQPEGWMLGLVRLEDVALGCVVSLVVGLLFWPRGAAASLRTAVSEAYDESARYLDQAVTFAAARCSAYPADAMPGASDVAPPELEATRAAAASRRLDDALRTFLTERGPKPVPLAELMTLVTGVAALRLAADAVLDLWAHDDPAPGERTVARAELRRRSTAVTGWFTELAHSLAEHRPVPEPVAADHSADTVLIDAVRRDLAAEDGTATGTAVRVIWTADHLDAARRLQATLIGPARAAIAVRSGHRQAVSVVAHRNSR